MWFWETQSPKFTDVILEKHHGLNKCKKPLNHIFHCEELILFFGVSRIRYPLPHCVLVAKSLTVLKLHSCKLDSIRSDISLPSLKRLSLLGIYVDNQIIQNLIFGCPMIEKMRISCSFRERESADTRETLRFCVLLERGRVQMKQRETKQIRKNLGFVLMDFEEGSFSLLTLFHLSKKHVLVTCNKILLNITVKITPGCKIWYIW